MKNCITVIIISFILTALLKVSSYAAEIHPQKVLIIASNMVDMGDPDKHDARNNLWEVAPPYHIFHIHGFKVDFVSPQGGQIPFMMDPLGISSYTIKYESFMDRANNSMSPKEINPEEYWGVYVGGGYGSLFDVNKDKEIQSIIANVYENGGIIGVTGHGGAAIADVILLDESALVKGKKIAAFPNSTEITKSWAKKGALLPFLVEDRLNKRGAYAQNKDTIENKNDVINDGRIVSTMFLPSAALVAKEMIILKNKLTQR